MVLQYMPYIGTLAALETLVGKINFTISQNKFLQYIAASKQWHCPRAHKSYISHYTLLCVLCQLIERTTISTWYTTYRYVKYVGSYVYHLSCFQTGVLRLRVALLWSVIYISHSGQLLNVGIVIVQSENLCTCNLRVWVYYYYLNHLSCVYNEYAAHSYLF